MVSLNLGKIVNIGTNLNNVSSSYIDLFVAYKVSDLAKASESYNIKLTATVNDLNIHFDYIVNVEETEISTIVT